MNSKQAKQIRIGVTRAKFDIIHLHRFGKFPFDSRLWCMSVSKLAAESRNKALDKETERTRKEIINILKRINP